MKYTYKTIDGVTYYSKQKSDSRLKDFALVIGTMYLAAQVYLLAFYNVTVM